MAEVLANQLPGNGVQAFSAGSRPAGLVHPESLACLKRHGITIPDGLHSKDWNGFAEKPLDLVITVCDNAAGESCPVYPGDPERLHWGIADPATVQGSRDEVEAAFDLAFETLRSRLAVLISGLGPNPSREQLLRTLDKVRETWE